jgi:hypothetical protein
MISSRTSSRLAAPAVGALLLALPFAGAAAAQPAAHPAPAAATPQPAAPAAAAPQPELPPEKGLKGEVWMLEHRDPDAIFRTLRAFGSGARGSYVNADTDLRAISARDFPENLALIGAAIKRLDVTEPARLDVDLKIHVLVASNGSEAGVPVPEDLNEVVAALKGTLRYRSYALLTTFVQRVRDRARHPSASGIAVLPAPEGKEGARYQVDFQAQDLRLEPGAAGATNVRMDDFSLGARPFSGGGNASVKTDLTLRPGEKVVVGTSSLGDRGLVVVVSASVAK